MVLEGVFYEEKPILSPQIYKISSSGSSYFKSILLNITIVEITLSFFDTLIILNICY